MNATRPPSFFRLVFHRLWVVVGAVTLTMTFFLVLPIIQAIANHGEPDTMIRDMDSGQLPQEEEEPVVEEKPHPEEEEPPPPELQPEIEPLTFEELNLVLEPGLGEGGWMGDGLAVKLQGFAGGSEEIEAMFQANAVEQKPRRIYDAPLNITNKVRKASPGQVYVALTVDERGRVKDAKAMTWSHPDLVKCAVHAVKQWQFEPGRRDGKPVEWRMRVPVSFPKM